MPGTKIINVLKDDTFKDILDLFRNSDAEDVVFVLPKRSTVFKREDHFAAFASEARRTDKKVSIMCSNEQVNEWATTYGFTVISKPAKPAVVTAAAVIDDRDEEARDPNIDAFDSDVVVPSDETVGVTDEGALDEEEGLHEEDEEANDIESDDGMDAGESDDDDNPDEGEDAGDVTEEASDDLTDGEDDDFEQVMKQYGPNDMDLYDADGNLMFSGGKPVVADLAVARPLDGVRSTRKGTSVGVKSQKEKTVKVGVKAKPEDFPEDGELDYIDAVWRDTVEPGDEPEPKTEKRWSKLFSSLPATGRKERSARTRWSTGASSRTRATITGVTVVAALAGGAFLILGLGKAHVEVVPVSRDLEFELSVQSSDAFGDVDPLFNKIPGQLFSIEKSVEREFNATGSQEVAAKAKGTLTVLNAYSTTAQTLIATTRFEDGSGQVFRTLQTVTVPGMSQDGDPGSIDVDVIADKPGPDYNIEATSFTIPAFREQGLADRFAKITGSSETAFIGGALGLSNVVTQQDLDDAVTSVTEELQRMVQEAFDAQSSDLELINAAQVNVTDIDPSVDVDQAADSFTVSANGSLSTVGFRTEDLFTLMEDHAQRNWQLTVLPDQLEVHFSDIRFVEDRGVLAFTATALGNGYVQIEEDRIVSDIAGKSRDDVRDYFRTAENVRSSTVILSPIWVRSVPDDASRIELELKYMAPDEP